MGSQRVVHDRVTELILIHWLLINDLLIIKSIGSDLFIFKRRKWQPTPIFLSRESHGQRSLVGYIPWGYKKLAMTEQLTL